MSEFGPPILFLAIAAAASGCAAVPAGVRIASLVGDGISYATTGKSLTDHLLSGAVQQDCALFRIVEGERVCRPVPLPEASATTGTSASSGTDPGSISNGTAAPTASPAIYLVVGSFRNPDYAQRCRNRYQSFGARLAKNRDRFGDRYRVLVGPVADARLEEIRDQLAVNGDVRPWRIRVCPGTPGSPPCAVMAAAFARD